MITTHHATGHPITVVYVRAPSGETVHRKYKGETLTFCGRPPHRYVEVPALLAGTWPLCKGCAPVTSTKGA